MTTERINALEQYYIKEHNTLIRNGYNAIEGGNLGFENKTFLDYSREKLIASQKAHYASLTPEEKEERRQIMLEAINRPEAKRKHKENLLKWLKNRVLTKEIRKKFGDATRGKTYEEIHGVVKAEELKAKRSESMKNQSSEFYKANAERLRKHNKGRKLGPQTKEHRHKISEALKGKKKSPEAIRKMAESKKGKKVSEATKIKLSTIRKGRKHAEETKVKMRLAQQKRRQKEKGGFSR